MAKYTKVSVIFWFFELKMLKTVDFMLDTCFNIDILNMKFIYYSLFFDTGKRHTIQGVPFCQVFIFIKDSVFRISHPSARPENFFL